MIVCQPAIKESKQDRPKELRMAQPAGTHGGGGH
jgi:hypothetical protein